MKEENKETKFKNKPWMQSLFGFIAVVAVLAGFLFWSSHSGRVEVEDAEIDAPKVSVSSTAAGVLNALYVKEGDMVSPNSQIALVGSNIVVTKEGGIVTNVPDILGGYYVPGQSVVSVVVKDKMRVQGSVEETKGLSDLKQGQEVIFTVDAFSGKKYYGIVDEVAETSNDANLAYSISDKRPVKRFYVYVRFNTEQYPELKDGMSAKITIITK